MSSTAFEPIDPPWGMLERDYVANGQQPAAMAAGASEEIDLDPDALYRGVDLQITFTYVAGTGGTLRPENPYSLISEIQVIGGNGDVLQRLSGYEAFLLAQLARGPGRPIDMTRVPAPTTAATNARAILPLDFTFIRDGSGIQPSHFGAIPARYLNGFKLRITYASSLTDAIAYGMGGSPTVTGTVVIQKRLVKHNSPAPQGYGTRIVQVSPQAVSSTADQTVNLEAGVRYAGILIVNRDTANAALSDSAGMTGDATLYLDGGTMRFKCSATLLRQETRSRFPTNYPGTTTQFDLTGVYFLDVGGLFCADDNDALTTLGQALDATGSRTVKLIIGGTAGTATSMRCTPVRVRSTVQSALALALPVA